MAGEPVRVVLRYRLDSQLLASSLTARLPRHLPAVATDLSGAQRPSPRSTSTVVLIDSALDDPGVMPRIVHTLTTSSQRPIIVSRANTEAEIELGHALKSAGAAAIWTIRDPLVALERLIVTEIEGTRRSSVLGTAWEHALHSTPQALTPREQDVVDLLFASEVMTLKAVGISLGITENTVKNHLAHVRQKLGARRAHNRTALRAALLERGWLS